MKTNKLLSAIVLLVFSCCTLFAQENYPTGSVLWKVSGKDLVKSSYILGTFHLKSGAYLDTIPGARAAFESSEQVVGEITLDNTQEMQMQVFAKMQMPADTTYHQLYSDEDYAFVSEQLTPLLGAGLDRVGQMKPAMLNMIVSVTMYLKAIPDFDPNSILDVYVQQEALKTQKSVIGLETVDTQIAMIDLLSLQKQADELLCNLKNKDLVVAHEITKVIEAYNRGDLNALSELLLQSDEGPCPLTKEEEDAMIKDRNDDWVRKLPAIMQDKSSFIAVGAGHLVGETGLLYQLQQAGYKIEAVQ
jgi:uncharacterized protein YbaP (TraB family)